MAATGVAFPAGVVIKPDGGFYVASVANGVIGEFDAAGTFVRRRLGVVAPLDLATGQLVAAAVILLPISLLSGIPPVPSPAAAGSLVTMGVVSTAIAWPVYFRILSRTTATAASSSTFLVPMFGIVWGGLILGEHVGPELLAGFALVIVSLILVLRLPVPRPVALRLSVGRFVARSTSAIAALFG